ncbi:MAG: tetratricopeptide repeat protein, partial [Mariprofundaceae bacterium]
MQLIKMLAAIGVFMVFGAVAVVYMASDSEHKTMDANLIEIGQSALEDKRYDDAFQWFEKSARESNAEGQFQLGSLYQKGLGADRDDEQAVRWFRLAAKQGHAKAQYQLATHLEYGRGVSLGLQEMVSWYQQAAEKGLGEAMYRLAIVYSDGRGIDQSDDHALKWVLVAKKKNIPEAAAYCQQLISRITNKARSGKPTSQYMLALMYGDGRGVAEDKKKMIYWLEKAANAGSA